MFGGRVICPGQISEIKKNEGRNESPFFNKS